MTEQKRPAKARLTRWQRATHAFLDARGFAPGPSLFRAIADALAAFFAESTAPFRLPSLLTFVPDSEIMALFEDRTGPLAFADARRVVAAVAVDFPQATLEQVQVGLKILAQGGWVESEYRCIDPETGKASAVSGEERMALLQRAYAAEPDDNTAACERLARITLDWRVVFPPQTRNIESP